MDYNFEASKCVSLLHFIPIGRKLLSSVVLYQTSPCPWENQLQVQYISQVLYVKKWDESWHLSCKLVHFSRKIQCASNDFDSKQHLVINRYASTFWILMFLRQCLVIKQNKKHFRRHCEKLQPKQSVPRMSDSGSTQRLEKEKKIDWIMFDVSKQWHKIEILVSPFRNKDSNSSILVSLFRNKLW